MPFIPIVTHEQTRGFMPLSIEPTDEERDWMAEAKAANPAATDAEIAAHMTERARKSKPLQPEPAEATRPAFRGAGASGSWDEEKPAKTQRVTLEQEDVAAKPENGAMRTLRAIGQVYPMVETAANLATQAVAMPVAGIAGLGAVASKAAGLTDTDPGDVVHKVAGAMTYQPQTEQGQHLTEAAMYPFTKLQEAGEAAGDKVFDATGSPTAATATRTVIEGVLPMAIVPAVKGARKAVSEAGERRAFSPSEEQRATTEDAIGSHIDDAMSKDVHIRSERAKTTEPTQAGAERLADDAQTMPGAEPQGFQALRSEGDQGLAGVAGKLRTVPEGHGAGADAMALAGQAGRAGELRAGELLVDDATATGKAPRLLPESGAARTDIDGGRGGAIARTAEPEHSIATAEARPSHGEPAGREVVPQLDMADVPWREPAAAGIGEASRHSETFAMEAPEVRMAARASAEPSATARPTRIFGRDAETYTDAELSQLSHTMQSDSLRRDVDAEIARRAGELLAEPDPVSAPTLAEPETLNSWAPGANFVPLVDDAKLPASQTKSAADLPAPIRRENIIADFAKGIGTSIYEGRVKGKNRLGFFRPKNEEVRIKRSNDLEVAAHEVAHLIDSRVPELKKAWDTDSALKAELKSVSYDQKNVREGFAEAMRLYLTQPDALEAKAPRVHAWLEGFANTHQYGEALRNTQKQMTDWYGQDALNRARSKIGTEKPLSQHFDGLFDRLRQATVDDLHGIYKMERDLTGKISPVGPYESARLSRAAASISDGAVRYGHPVKQPNGSFTFKGKGLEEILKPVSESLDDAMLYFVGRSSRELLAQGREHLFTPAEIDAMLRLATPERKKAFEEYQAWNRGVLDFAEAQGVINSQARATWQRTQYLPFHRVGQSDGFKGSKPGDWSGVKALTGGSENIKDVLANMVQNAAQLVDKAVKNEARVKIADLADKVKGGRFMVKIDPEATARVR